MEKLARKIGEGVLVSVGLNEERWEFTHAGSGVVVIRGDGCVHLFGIP